MYRPSLLQRTIARVAEKVDHRWGWDRLPAYPGLLALLGIRETLREDNLYDGFGPTPDPGPMPVTDVRTVDGSWTSLESPTMGMAGTRFGRNVTVAAGRPETGDRLLDPNPRTVSTELLLRHDFIPATTLNVLAGAWLQFETRDWFSHGHSELDRALEVPRPSGDDWPEDPIRMPRTVPDHTARLLPDGSTETFLNTETHWWDASQLYGSTREFQQAIRTGSGGTVRIGADGLVDVDPALLSSSGGADGFWLGLELMHTVFMREHNAICARLARTYPSWNDEQLFGKARLINAALIAKIHTVEWTPAILGHPTLQLGMRANWWGIAGERVYRRFGRFGTGDFLFGIPGSETEQHAAPYSITEDFVSVYRMHPLLPDDFVMADAARGSTLEELEFMSLFGLGSRETIDRIGIANAFYSLGIAHPGAVTLHNSPRFMHRLARTDGEHIDLAALDVLRSRERGVPRYAEFRRQLHMRPLRGFEDFGVDEETRARMRSIYDDDLEKVDLTVGMFGEKLPRGFGFSDTAFRIFLLMASRRLKSDRFYTIDFRPEVYTPEGMDWLDTTTMSTVLLRHYPELAPALRGVRNAFAPWQATA
ncbi:peroxidase family protein [Nocardioides insulae]|uniref:peroxidase family protein n=1 Tax=Nocardioides insulae TaxID=394734 RepID=UPI0004264707|nr:peroxidase family protein [Nocardioides insulae]